MGLHKLTAEEFAIVLPKRFHKDLSQELMDHVNMSLNSDPAEESYRDNLLEYCGVLAQGKFKITGYINAVKFVSFRMLGNTKKDAYIKTFPGRYSRYVAKGHSEREIASIAHGYSNSKIVVLILAQAMTPVHVINAGLFQRAINTQAMIMNAPDASYKVRSDAANYLMNTLKPPETAKIELDMKVSEDESLTELRAATVEFARQARDAIVAGQASPKSIAESTIRKPKENFIELEPTN